MANQYTKSKNTTSAPSKAETTKYFFLITQEEDAQRSEQAGLDNDQAMINMATEQLKVKQELLAATRALAASKKAIPFVPNDVYKHINSVDTLTRKLNILNNIESELF